MSHPHELKCKDCGGDVLPAVQSRYQRIRCEPCHRTKDTRRVQRYYARNIEVQREKRRAYRLANHDKIKVRREARLEALATGKPIGQILTAWGFE